MRGLRGVGIQGLANPVFSAGCPGDGLFNTILSYNPIAYWPLNDLSGTTAINYGSLGTAANGVHANITLNSIDAPGGTTAPLYSLNTSRTNIYSAAFAGAFNGQLGWALSWIKVYSSSEWTDGAERCFLSLYVDAPNYINIQKNSANNTIRAIYRAGGTTEAITSSTSSTDWLLSVITWDKAADQVKYYLNDSLVATNTALGIFAGSLASAFTNIGCQGVTSQVWKGYICHTAVSSSTVLTLPEIQNIYFTGRI